MTLSSIVDWFVHVGDFYARHDVFANVTLTVLALMGAFAVRRFWVSILPSDLSLETRRKKVVGIRNGVGAATVVFIIMLWSTELKTLIVSLIAIAAAVVLATKEVIMSMIGGIVRTTTQRYQIGDRIEIKDFRGDVIDISLLSTTLMELNPTPGVHMSTGKVVFLPHSLILTEVLRVHHTTSSYSVHTFSVPVANGQNAALEQARLHAICLTACESYIDEAANHFKMIQDHTSIDMPSSAPKTLVHSDNKGSWWLTTRLVAPLKRVQSMEQEIIATFLREAPPLPAGTQALDKKNDS